MDILTELQAWYRAQCDGWWENDWGVTIETLDNPGWMVTINLQGTPLAGKAFVPVQRGDFSRNDPQPPWINCKVEDAVFRGYGDANTLAEILELFLSWAAAVSSPSYRD
jgi:hypothetical protein